MEAQVLIGFEGLPYKSKDYYAIQILASVLGGGMSSRLFQEIREKHGLCYAIYSFHWAFSDTGLFGCACGHQPGRSRRPDADDRRRAGVGLPDDHG